MGEAAVLPQLPIHDIPRGDEGILDGTAGVMVLASADDEYVAGFDGVLDTVDRQHAAALNEDEHFIHIVDVARFGMCGFTRLEHVYAAVDDFRIAELPGQQARAVGSQV